MVRLVAVVLSLPVFSARLRVAYCKLLECSKSVLFFLHRAVRSLSLVGVRGNPARDKPSDKMNKRSFYFRDETTGKRFEIVCVKRSTAVRRAVKKAGHRDITLIQEGAP